MRILIADDHPLVIDGLRLAFEQLDAEVEIVECANFMEADQRAEMEPGIDLAILDFRMPGMDGIEGVEKFVNKYGDTPTVVISGNYSSSDVSEVLVRGAAGFLPKSLTRNGLVNAIRMVVAGEIYIPADILPDLLKHNGQKSTASENLASGGALDRLSKRETQVLAELINGQQNKEIARTLEIQEVTVKLHVKNIYKKIGASNRAHAVKIAFDLGWNG